MEIVDRVKHLSYVQTWFFGISEHFCKYLIVWNRFKPSKNVIIWRENNPDNQAIFRDMVYGGNCSTRCSSLFSLPLNHRSMVTRKLSTSMDIDSTRTSDSDWRIKRISFGWHSIPTSFPLRNIPIERSVLRIPRNVLFTRRVSIPCFRSIKGSAISWSHKGGSRLFLSSSLRHAGCLVASRLRFHFRQTVSLLHTFPFFLPFFFFSSLSFLNKISNASCVTLKTCSLCKKGKWSNIIRGINVFSRNNKYILKSRTKRILPLKQIYHWKRNCSIYAILILYSTFRKSILKS